MSEFTTDNVVLNFAFFRFSNWFWFNVSIVTGCEKWYRTRPGFESGPPSGISSQMLYQLSYLAPIFETVWPSYPPLNNLHLLRSPRLFPCQFQEYLPLMHQCPIQGESVIVTCLANTGDVRTEPTHLKFWRTWGQSSRNHQSLTSSRWWMTPSYLSCPQERSVYVDPLFVFFQILKLLQCFENT